MHRGHLSIYDRKVIKYWCSYKISLSLVSFALISWFEFQFRWRFFLPLLSRLMFSMRAFIWAAPTPWSRLRLHQAPNQMTIFTEYLVLRMPLYRAPSSIALSNTYRSEQIQRNGEKLGTGNCHCLLALLAYDLHECLCLLRTIIPMATVSCLHDRWALYEYPANKGVLKRNPWNICNGVW